MIPSSIVPSRLGWPACLRVTLPLFTLITLPAWAVLNDTGIDWCADASNNNIICPVAGFPGQDGEHGRDVTDPDPSDGHAGFSLTKLDDQGQDLPADAIHWYCVRDNVTGLIWEVKTDDGGMRDKDWTYSWYDSTPSFGVSGTENGGHCPASGRCDTEKYVADVNSHGLCGSTDWRMPTTQELAGIAHLGRVNPTIDTTYFPNTLGERFWSALPNAFYLDSAWVVDFNRGDQYNHLMRNTARARLVHGTSPPLSFVDNSDGTVTEQTTGLMWAQCSAGQSGDDCSGTTTPMRWVNALTYAENATLAGYDDWRLPTVKELGTLISYARYNPSIDDNDFPSTPSSWFWSASPYAHNPNSAWYIGFGHGHVYGTTKTNRFDVRLVRDGECLRSLDLTIAGTGSGEVTSDPSGIDCGSDCHTAYACDTVVTLTASPAYGSVLTGWSGDTSCGATLACAVTLDSNKTITATFDPLIVVTHDIDTDVDPSAGGSVTCTPNPVDDGDSSTCIATPADGYQFSAWSGDCSGTSTSCTLSNVTSDKSVTATFTLASQGSATQSAPNAYLPGALLTVTNVFDNTSAEDLLSLTWLPQLPSGWNIVDTEGDGAPRVVNNEIVFGERIVQQTIAFHYRISVPHEARGDQTIAASAHYQLESMINSGSLPVQPTLSLSQHPIVPHSADYAEPHWSLSADEYSRMLAYWRAGAYHVNASGVDGYAHGTGSTFGDRHSADYQDPPWHIDVFEVNRVLAYWRALAYRVDPDSIDGYAPGAQQTLTHLALAPATTAGIEAPSATHTTASNHYTAGRTLTITNTIGQRGNARLLSLLWLPHLPSGWTITTVSGPGSPEIAPDGNQILLTGSDLTLPLSFTYSIQAPTSASGQQTIQADFQYWWNDQRMVDPATVSLEPIRLSDSGAMPGDCSNHEIVLNTMISGTQTQRSEVRIRTSGSIQVPSGASLTLSAPRIAFAPGFRVVAGGKLRAIAQSVTCAAGSVTSVQRASELVLPPAELFAPTLLARPEALPVWLHERLAWHGIDADALTGGLLDAEERWLILETAQALHPQDRNAVSDLYRLDLLSDRLDLLSVTADGSAGNGPSRDPAADALGERVVFTSEANDLAPGDDNGVSDLFLRDLALGHTERLTLADQASAHPAVDAQGIALVYDQTTAAGPRQVLAQAVADGPSAKVVVLSEADAAGDAYRPAISADGRFLAYLSQSLAAEDGGGCTVVIRDLVSGSDQRQTCPAGLRDASDWRIRPAFSSDGGALYWHGSGQDPVTVLPNPLADGFSPN